MGDKSLDIFLMLVFGIGGITIFIVAWTQPMSVLERVLTVSIGSFGLFWVLVRSISLRSMLVKLGIRKSHLDRH